MKIIIVQNTKFFLFCLCDKGADILTQRIQTSNNQYNENIDSSSLNEFSNAAFRTFHQNVPIYVEFYDEGSLDNNYISFFFKSPI